MTTLLHISDTHFGTERPAVIVALQQLSKKIAPDVLVVSGDITQRARRAQFATARSIVNTLGAKHVLAVPGNHDIPLFNLLARAFAPYSNHRRAFGDDLEPIFESNRLLVLCVNTTRAYRHKDGEVSLGQIERVARSLRAAQPAQLRVVVTHQPIAVTLARDEKNRLHGAERALRQWSEGGADVILGGHIHLPFLIALHERSPDLPRRVWALQAGTAVSRRVRGGINNSVNVIKRPAGEPRRAVIERWDYRDAGSCFERVRSDDIECDAR